MISTSLADPLLVDLLADLVSEERLPPVDRWFARRAKILGWRPSEQKRLWDALRVALARTYELVDSALPMDSTWSGVRRALRGRTHEWAVRATLDREAETLDQAGVPRWLTASWEERCRRSWDGNAQARFLVAQERAAPTHVRYRWGPEGTALAARLRSEGVVAPSDVDGVDRVVSGRDLEHGTEGRAGWIEIQDAASQLSLVRAAIRPGMRVWDVCAGRGGKALLAANELRGKGALMATEIAPAKLEGLHDRVRRSGWQNIRILPWDGEVTPTWGAEVQTRGGFDRVIVDAPCSASGTWRRDPEGRFRLDPRALKDLGRHQRRLLRLGWQALRSGGRLVYITCSWLPEENEAVIEEFLGETPEARLAHEELLGLPAFDANTLYTAVVEKP